MHTCTNTRNTTDGSILTPCEDCARDMRAARSREIELYTAGGDFVAVVEILPFFDGNMPKVVIWGERVFVCNDMGQTDVPRWKYNECFSVVSLTASPGLPR